MGASPSAIPAGAPATPPSPVIPPDSTQGAAPADVLSTLESLLQEDDHPSPGTPEPEPPAAEPPAETKPAADAGPEFPPDDEKKAAPELPDEITFPGEEPEGEADGNKAEPEDKHLDGLTKQRDELAAKGQTDKDLDDKIRGAFLSKPRGQRMMERDKYARELQSEFGQLPEIKDLKEIRQKADAVERMLDDFHEADESPGNAQTFLEYWLTPVVEEGRQPELRPGAVSVIRTLPGFLAANPATQQLWYREIVPSVAMSLSDAFYAMSRKATSDREKAGMHATAQWLDQHFLGKVRSQALDEPPKSRVNGSDGKPDPEMQRIVAERDQLKQRLGWQETNRFNSFVGTVMNAADRHIEADIEHVFKEIRGQVAPRLFKSFTKDLQAEIASALAGDDDFYRNFERGVRGAHKAPPGDQGAAIDRLSKSYRDKARAYVRKNYQTLRADLVGGTSANGISAASQKVADSEKRHAAHAKAQERKGPEGGTATPGIRMAPVSDRRPGESKEDYLLREMSS
jgi:hypothetical protein